MCVGSVCSVNEWVCVCMGCAHEVCVWVGVGCACGVCVFEWCLRGGVYVECLVLVEYVYVICVFV